jgi:hypothetical protein
MQKADPLIRTKLRLPFSRPEFVPRPRLQVLITEGLHGPLTLITAPAGFGKTNLAASSVASCGMPVAWLSLDKNDNLAGRFLNYLVAVLQGADNMIGSEAAQLLAASQPAPSEMAIPEEDWERTQPSVQAVLLALWQENRTFKGQMAGAQAELEKLGERVNMNSRTRIHSSNISNTMLTVYSAIVAVS